MILKLRNPREVPPGYWRFPRNPSGPEPSDPQDFIWGGDFQNLIAKVHEYRVINSLPLGNPEEEIGDWLCRHTGAQCAPSNPPKPLPGVRASGSMVARFLSAMALWTVSSEKVDQEEAELRGETCSNCEHNADIDDQTCLGCFGLIGRIINIIGDRKTRVDSSLKNCNICGCVNAVQAFVPIEILGRVHNLSDFPTDIGDGKTKCWKRAWVDKQNASQNAT